MRLASEQKVNGCRHDWRLTHGQQTDSENPGCRSDKAYAELAPRSVFVLWANAYRVAVVPGAGGIGHTAVPSVTKSWLSGPVATGIPPVKSPNDGSTVMARVW